MGESLVQVTEGSGKKLHTWSRTIGGNVVEDEIIVRGDQYLPAYTTGANGSAIATSADHLLQIMAGASLAVRIRRIRMQQVALGGAAATAFFTIRRLSTAGTGGTAVTPERMDAGDAAPGATSMILPTAKGTETGELMKTWAIPVESAQPIRAQPWEWIEAPGSKPLIIAAGATNGIAIKVTTGIATVTFAVFVEFTEQSFVL